MLFIIILSALCYSGALCIAGAEFLVFVTPPLLGYGLAHASSLWAALSSGVCWGYIVYGCSCLWALHVLTAFTHAYAAVAVLIYLCVMGYFALTVGIWCALTWLWLQRTRCWWSALRWMGVALIGFFYLICVDYWILFPLGKLEGFPFVLPYIPLASYTWFLRGCAFVSCCWSGGGHTNDNHAWQRVVRIEYIAPILNKQYGVVRYAENPCAVGQEIHRALCRAKRYPHDGKETLFVTPESMYPFIMNDHQDQVELWLAALKEREHFFLGSYYQINQKLYQTIFHWHDSRIMHVYVKKHCVPFVEKIHRPWRWLQVASELFLKDCLFFSRGNHHIGCSVFDVGGVAIIPQICSELFMKTRISEVECKRSLFRRGVVCAFINDSWFPAYFKRILRNIVQFKAAWWCIDIIYIGHEDCKVLYSV